MSWRHLIIPRHELDLSTVLRSGQAFRWRNINNVWSCALNNQIILLRENPELVSDAAHILEYMNIEPAVKSETSDDTEKFLTEYFNLDISSIDLHAKWCQYDTYFPKFEESRVKLEPDLDILTPPESARESPVSEIIPRGVRILSQDPWETLVSFIISSNNNIKRISQLCEVLCISYGKFLGKHDGVPYYTFPQPHEFLRVKKGDEITDDDYTALESELRSLGFGYRAGYIMKTVRKMLQNPNLFEQLMTGKWSDDEACVQFLLQFDGVGPKVADCVALMGCHRHELVPVDTHVWKVLKNRYREEFKNWVDSIPDEEELKVPKSTVKKALANQGVDLKTYPFVKRFFREFWQIKAGWAQAVVFAGIVKLDNGINHIDDVEKLIIKIENSKYPDQPQPPKKKRQRVK